MKKLLLGIAAVCLAAPLFAQEAKVENATYDKVGEYTLTNLWIKSAATGNNMSVAEYLGGANDSRGMALKGEEMYFAYRADFTGIKVYNIKDGEKIKDIVFNMDDFKVCVYKTDEETQQKELTDDNEPGYLANDIQVDDAGNVVTFTMTTDMATAQTALWVIDMETGKPTKVMDLINVEGLLDGYRIDYFAVKGNVLKDAIVMFPVSSSNNVIRCDIKDGQLAPVTSGDYEGFDFQVIEIKEYAPASAADNGTGPRISIVDEDYFYLDGFNSGATLYDMSGSIVESVYDAPEDCALKNVGDNGVTEFTLNNTPFCAYVISNTVAQPYQAFKVIEMGEGPTFATATYYWTIPQNGLGDISNPVRTALPRIARAIDKNGKEAAYIAVYAAGSGAAAYKMVPDGFDEDSEVIDAVEGVGADNVKIFVNGNVISFSGKAHATVYNFAGQKVAEAAGVTAMAAPAKGLYIVKAVVDGVEKVQKVVVK